MTYSIAKQSTDDKDNEYCVQDGGAWIGSKLTPEMASRLVESRVALDVAKLNREAAELNLKAATIAKEE